MGETIVVKEQLYDVKFLWKHDDWSTGKTYTLYRRQTLPFVPSVGQEFRQEMYSGWSATTPNADIGTICRVMVTLPYERYNTDDSPYASVEAEVMVRARRDKGESSDDFVKRMCNKEGWSVSRS